MVRVRAEAASEPWEGVAELDGLAAVQSYLKPSLFEGFVISTGLTGDLRAARNALREALGPGQPRSGFQSIADMIRGR